MLAVVAASFLAFAMVVFVAAMWVLDLGRSVAVLPVVAIVGAAEAASSVELVVANFAAVVAASFVAFGVANFVGFVVASFVFLGVVFVVFAGWLVFRPFGLVLCFVV